MIQGDSFFLTILNHECERKKNNQKCYRQMHEELYCPTPLTTNNKTQMLYFTIKPLNIVCILTLRELNKNFNWRHTST